MPSIGSSATASSSNDALVLGKEAKAASAADSIVMGTSAAVNSADVVAIGSRTSATGANSVVIGKSAQTTSEGGNAIGSSSTASGRSTAIGQSATANNFDALAIGNGATANADRSISLGYHAGVGTTEGKGETQTSGSLIAIGTEAGNNVAGMQNIAIGSSAGSDTKSNYNVAIGSSAGYNISYSDDSKNQNGYNVSIGYKANYQDTAANIMNAISIGEKNNAENYAVAIGGEAQATGTNSIALGYKATAADTDSMALGYNSSAANGNIAIGVGSTAPKITMSTAYLTGDAAPSTYISVGTSDNLRRISNVADGSAAQDVVTVHQLTTAYTDLENTIKGIDTTSLNTYSTTAIDSKVADVKSQIANAKTKYFSYSTSTSTLAANADNTGATATAADAMAIGPNANATNTKTLAIGNNVYATGLRSIAIGTADNPTTDSAGTTTTHNTSAEGENSIALGTSTTAQSDNSVAIGTRAQTYTTDTTKGSITGVKAVAIGYSATTAGDTSVAVGNNATVKYASGTAVGTDSLADGTNAVAIGEGSKAYSDNSTAIGQGNSITGNNTYGLGSSNTVSGAWGSVTTSGVSGYNNSVTSVSDANTMNAISGIYITGNSNRLTQNVVNNVVSDITAMGSSNTIDVGAGGTSSHPNILSQIAIVGSGNTVQGKSSDDSKTNNIKDVTILGYNNKVDANTDTTVDFSNTQILGSNVTAKLGNSVYLGSNAAYIGQTTAASDAITSARTAADAAAEASDAYKAATTDAAKAQIKAKYEAQYLYKLNVEAMEAKGTTAGTQSYSTDETYGDGTSYTYAGSSPTGVVTVGSVGGERRIQNVAAGLVSASSTDAVNGSQLYALTRQLRFGGDNSTFGADSAADTNVIARGSAQTLAITGGAGVETNNTDGVTTITVDSSKLTDNNIGVIANKDTNALNVKLASNLTSLNTAQLGTGSGTSYKETIKLDGTGASGGSIALKDAEGTLKNTVDTTGMNLTSGAKFTSSGISAGSQQINAVKAGTDDTDAVNYGQLKNARTLLQKGTNTTLTDSVNGDQHTYTVNVDNLAVKANGTDQASVALGTGLKFQNGTNTTAAVASDGTVTISATHNKLASVTANAATATSDDANLTLQDADGNKVTSTGLKNTYTTISKNGTDHTVTFARNDGVTNTLSLGDLNGASKDDLNSSMTTLNSTIQTAAAKATSTVVEGDNVASVTDDTTSADGHHIYTVNVDNLAVKVNSTQKSIQLKDGLVFGNGTNITATLSDDGAITYNVSNAAIKTQAKDAINLTAGSNVTVDTTTSVDGTTKTFTVNATHNKLASATATTGNQDNVTLTLTDADGNEVTSTGLKNTYSTGGSVTYAAAGEGTATVTRNDGKTYTITGLKDTKVTSGTASYGGTQGNAGGTATLTMNDGTTATISGLKDDYITSAAVGTGNNHVTMTRLGGGTVDLDLNPILGKYSLSDYHLVGAGTTHNQVYAVDSNGTVTLNVVDDKNPDGAAKTIQLTGLASQSGVNAGRTTVKSSDSSITVSDSTANSDTHTYDIKVDYSKIPANLKVQYSGDNVTSGSNTMDTATAFSGAAGQIVTTAADGKVSFKLADNISGIQSVTTGDAKLATTGLTITEGPSVLKTGINAGGKTISNVGDAVNETDAATLKQVKNARTKVAAGDNVKEVASSEATDGSHQMTYTVNVDNLPVKANKEGAKSVTLKKGLTFNNGTNTTASVGDNGEVKYDLNSTLTGLTSVTVGNSTLDNSGLTIKAGTTTKVAITGDNVTMGGNIIHSVGDGVTATDAVNKGQLDALQSQVSGGWNLSGINSEGTAVTVQIGAGKTVTYSNGSYTKSVITKDDSGNATVKVDVTTGTLTTGADGKITSSDGLATTEAVAVAVNNASWKIQDGNKSQNAQQVKAGDTVSLKAGDNLSLEQNGKEFTYKLNQTLTNMNSVTAVDDKQNTAVLNGEGLKVTDAQGNALTQHATEVRLHDANKAVDDTTTDVVLNKQGLQNGGHTITGVADGTVDASSQDAVNGSQLYALQQKVTNGWKITGADTTKASNIGNDKTVSFVNGDNSYIKSKVDTTNTGATVSYTAQTASLTTTDGKAALTGTMDGLVTGRNLTSVLNNLSWTAQSSKVGSGQNSSSTSQSIAAGSKVSFIAGDNMILTQDGTNFTYALNSSLTGMNTIAFTGLGNGASNLTIGLQNGGGANPDKGYYITGLSNTKWDQSNYEGTRAATEAQLREAIDKVSAATGTGGFGLTADEGANNGGEKKVSQTLGRTIAIQGDGTYGADGTVVKRGNISTVAYTDNAGPTGAIKVKLNKDIDLSEAGSLTIGASKVSAGSIVLDNTGDASKKIALNSTAGTASIGGVTVDGAAKTVMGLANTTWDGTAVRGRAATEDQLAKAISDVSEQATNSELHIRKGTYSVGKDKDGQDVADPEGKNSVSIDVVNATGTVDGQVVINDVAKASELGAVGELAANLKNPAGGPTTVVQAVNNVNQKVDDSLKQVNGDITSAVTEAKKHTEVKSVDSDNNVTIDGTTTNAAGGTVYKLGLNKDHLNLGNVHIYGNEGRVTAKTVEAEMVKIDDQTRLDKTGLTTGNTMVANNRIVVGGDNGIKIEANGGQQTISGLTNTDWTGTAVHGRAATEDQLAKAISSATTTAAQNEQHIQAGTYDIQTTTDDKGNKQNKVTMKIVDGNGNDKGTVTINDVAKASNVGDTDKLAADIKNQNGGQPQTTSVVEAVNNLNEKVNNRVGDNKYSAITSTDPVQDGDSSTMAIGKLNNRMNDIYQTAGQHTTVSNTDKNLDIKPTTDGKGKTNYEINLSKQVNLGDVKLDGEKGTIEAKSVKADSFTSGATVVNNDGVQVGKGTALSSDSLKVGDNTYVDNKGLNANGNAIRNVGDGKDSGDAVNMKQLNEVKSDYQTADAKLADAIQQTDAGLNEVGRAVNKLGNRLNRVGAGAAALAALHPGTYDPNDKWDFSAGIGHYHDANAVAIGAYYHPNDTTILSIGGSMGGGENMVNAGITWKMGRSGHEQRAAQPVVTHPVQAAPVVQQAAPARPAPVATPAPVVTPAPVTTPVPVKAVVPATPVPAVTTAMTAAPSGDTAALTQILARQTAILEKLAQNQSQAARPAAAHGDDIFPDVPDNHWAYAYVAKLEKAGALKGFKRPAVLKSPMMTRDDFASVLYTAMANGATTNPALNGDDSLNRLAQEFKAELKDVKP